MSKVGFDDAVEAGWSLRGACRELELGEVRAYRWIERRAAGELADRAPGGSPMHGLLDNEVAEIIALYHEWGDIDRSHRKAVVEMAWLFVDSNIFAASTCVDAVADSFIATREYDQAAAILQEFAARVPGQVNALLKLVAVCVDGGLEPKLQEAQAQLADTYLAIGMGSARGDRRGSRCARAVGARARGTFCGALQIMKWPT